MRVLPNTKKRARAVISSAKWLRGTPEQRFRAASGCGARPSSDFECKARPVQYFRVLSAWLGAFQSPIRAEDLIYNISEVGGCAPGKSFRFVRACVRAVWLPSGIGSQILWAGFFPFPFCPGLVVGLFLCGPGWSRGAFPFPFWARELSLFPSPTPQISYPTLVGLIGVCHMHWSEIWHFSVLYIERHVS